MATSGFDDVNLVLDRDETIVNFFLGGYCIGPQGAFMLSTSFPVKFVRVLELRSQNIGVTGAPHLAKAIARHPSLVYVGLARNHIGSHGASEILRTLMYPECVITGVDLQWNDLADRCAKTLGEVLAVNKTLLSINMDRNRIRKEGADGIAEGLKVNKTLQNLSLGWNRIRLGVESLGRALSVNTTLHTLNVCDNEVIGENAIILAESMSNNKTLHSLDISNNTLGDATVVFLTALAKGTLGLRELHMTGCKVPFTEPIASALRSVYRTNTTLFFLNLANNPMKDGCITPYLESCKNSVALRVLDVSTCQTSHLSLACLTHVTTTCPYLHTLNFEGNDLGATGAALVALAMGAATGSVTSLNMSKTRMTPAGARALATGLGQQRRLVHLFVSDNELGSDGVSEICMSLLGYGALETLDVSTNRAASIITTYLRRVILAHEGLSHISVIGNSCCTELQGGVYSRSHAEVLVIEQQVSSRETAPGNPQQDATIISGEVTTAPKESNTTEPHRQAYNRKWNNFNRGTAVKEILAPNATLAERNAALFFTTPATSPSMTRLPGTSAKAQMDVSRSNMITIFSRLDKDGSGFLDLAEVRKFVSNLESYGVTYSKRQIDEMLLRYGALKDGQLSFDEFEVVMLQMAKR